MMFDIGKYSVKMFLEDVDGVNAKLLKEKRGDTPQMIFTLTRTSDYFTEKYGRKPSSLHRAVLLMHVLEYVCGHIDPLLGRSLAELCSEREDHVMFSDKALSKVFRYFTCKQRRNMMPDFDKVFGRRR